MPPVVLYRAARAAMAANKARKEYAEYKGKKSAEENEADTNRGISGTTARFGTGLAKRLTANSFNKKHSNTRKRASNIFESYIDERTKARFGKTNVAEARRVYKQMEAIFASEGEEIPGEEGETTVFQNPPKHPDFPIFIFGLAVLKDTLDVLGYATLFGWLVLWPISICISVILFMWTLSRLKLEYMSKHRMRKLTIRGIAFFIEAFVKGVDVLPLSTLFVLLTHFDESKIVKLIYRAVGTYSKQQQN